MNGPPLQLHMLVVDDDDLDRERVRRFLAKSPLQVDVTEAASGEEALRLVRSQVFDCVVLDNQLGDASGRDLLPQLHREARRDCPIIFITGVGNEALAVHVIQEGAADYLAKTSLNAEALVRAVRRSIENHRLQCENERLHQQLEQRVEAQAVTIRQRERDLHALVDNLPTLMSHWGEDQCCRFGNLPHEEWFGVSAASLPGMTLRKLLGPELWPTFELPVRRVLQGKSTGFECVVPALSGRLQRDVQVQLLPDVDDDGRIAGFYLSMADVGPQKQAQARIEELLAFSDAVIENSPIGIAVFERAGNCVLANSAFIELCGDTLDDLRAHDFRSRRDWLAGGLVDAALRTLADGQPRRSEFTLKSGPRITGEWACAITRVDRGGDPHLLLIAHDIGEQRRAHAALVEARDAAQAGARAKGTFLANMSHEIRTPMNAIVGLSRLALEDELPAPTRAYLDKVHNAAAALMGVLDDVLDYSKIEAGHLRIERVAVDLEAVLARVVDLFQARIDQQDLTLGVDLSPAIPRLVWGDPLRLSQVLNNLVGNAVKFTQRGGIRLAVSVLAANPARNDGAFMRFSVADTGIGLTREAREALFEAFVQADDSVTRRFGGTGLGLAICKRLVGMMGGQIGVSSEPGAGSEFWFTLPLAPASAAMDRESRPDLAGLRVLLFDPDDAARAVTLRHLAAWGAIARTIAMLSDLAAPPGPEAASTQVLLFDAAGFQAADAALLVRFASGAPAVRMIAIASAAERLRLQKSAAYALFDAVLPRPAMASRLLEALSVTEPPARLARAVANAPKVHPGAADAASALRALSAPLLGLQVLLVEDNALNQVVATEFLRRAGMAVTVAADGQAAFEVVRSAPVGYFSAVLMDLHMPVVDGLEATRRIRSELPHAREIPIIGMTAAALPEDRERCLAAGMIDHLAKPFLPEQVVRTLLRWVVARPVDREHPDRPEREPAMSQLNRAADVPAFDPALLRERLHGNERLAREVISAFVAHERETAENLATWIAADDKAKARDKAHELKGAAGTAGAMPTYLAADALQLALDSGTPTADALAHVRRTLHDALVAMSSFLAGAGSDETT